MPDRLHPGVYVEEVSGGVKPIEGVSTSTAAFVGEAPRGVPARAQLVTGFGEFERAFGGFSPGDAGLLAHAVSGFFEAGGARAYVVRVLPANATRAETAPIPSRVPGASPPAALRFVAKGAGAWGEDLRIAIGAATHFEADAFRVEVQSIEHGAARRLEVFDDVRMDPGHEDYVVERMRTSRYVEAVDLFAEALAGPQPPTLPAAAAPRLTAVAPTGDTYAIPAGKELTVTAWDVGRPDAPQIGTIVVNPTTAGVAATNGVFALSREQLVALLVNLGEAFEVSLQDNLPSIAISASAGLDLTRPEQLRMSITERITATAPPVLRTLGFPAQSRGYAASSPANPLVRPALTAAGAQPTPLTGGSDGAGLITASDFAGSADARTGLHALDGIDVNLVAMPGKNEPAYLSAGIAYCDVRGDCFFIADGPGGSDRAIEVNPEDARAFIDSLPVRSMNSAMFYPWLRVSDPVGLGRNPTRFVAPSGHVAGIFARTDATRGVWKAPAGIEASVGAALGLQYQVLDAEQDLLNPASLNCLRQFPGVGIVSWGSRTLSPDPEWRYVPVRRTGLFLKESLRRGLQWAVFEPNDTELWGRIKINIDAFMMTLFRQGAFQGATPDEAFAVVCDRTTNPQENVDAGIVTARVAFAPLKPAEFVVIEISQKSLLVA